jgi:hypothetical protein
MPNEDNSTNSPTLGNWSSLLSSVGYGFWILRVWTASVTHNDTICPLNSNGTSPQRSPASLYAPGISGSKYSCSFWLSSSVNLPR